MTQNDHEVGIEQNFTFSYTPELAVAALQQHYYNHRKNFLPPLFALLCGLLGLLQSRGDAIVTILATFAGFFIIYFLEFLVLKIFYPWIANRQFSKTPVYRQEMHFTVQKDRLHVKTSKSENAILWTDITKWVRTPNFDMLYTGPQLYYVLPKERVDLDLLYTTYQVLKENAEGASPISSLEKISARFKYQLTEADIIAASHLHTAKNPRNAHLFHICLASIPALLTTSTRGFSFMMAGLIFTIVFILLKLIDFIFDRIILTKIATRKFRKSPYLHHAYGIECDREKSEIQIHSFAGITQVTSDDVIKVRKSQTHYLLYIGPRLYIILPIAQLRKQQFDFDAFDAILNNMDIKIEAR